MFCLIGGRTERGFRQGSQALERSTGGSWAARGRHGPPSARPRGAASAARGAAELGASAGQGPPGCTWLSPAPPESAAAAGFAGASGPWQLRSLQGALRLPIACGEFVQTFRSWEDRRGSSGSREPWGPGGCPGLSCRGSPRSVTALRAVTGVFVCVWGRTGCSILTTRVNLGLVWRQGSCRSYEWCFRLLWVKSRGGRRGSSGLPA